MITCHNLSRRFEDVKDDYFESLKNISKNEKATNGYYVQQAEKQLTDISGRQYVLLVRSGSHAISLSLLAYGIKPGDEVIIPNYSCPATLSSVCVINAVPRFCEVNKYGSLDTELLEACVTNRTRAILATGLYGDVHNHSEVKSICDKHGLTYINDAAQSQFALYNGVNSLSLGDTVTISFAENKPIPTLGTFGAVLTDDEQVYNQVRVLRKNGKLSRHSTYECAGYSSYPEEDKAAQIVAAMKHFNKWQKRRADIVKVYDEQFNKHGVNIRPRPEYSKWNTHKYAIMVDDKFKMYKKLLADGVESEQHYVDNFAKLPWTPNTNKEFPMTDNFIKQSLSIPLNAHMTDSEVDEVVEKVCINDN